MIKLNHDSGMRLYKNLKSKGNIELGNRQRPTTDTIKLLELTQHVIKKGS